MAHRLLNVPELATVRLSDHVRESMRPPAEVKAAARQLSIGMQVEGIAGTAHDKDTAAPDFLVCWADSKISGVTELGGRRDVEVEYLDGSRVWHDARDVLLEESPEIRVVPMHVEIASEALSASESDSDHIYQDGDQKRKRNSPGQAGPKTKAKKAHSRDDDSTSREDSSDPSPSSEMEKLKKKKKKNAKQKTQVQAVSTEWLDQLQASLDVGGEQAATVWKSVVKLRRTQPHQLCHHFRVCCTRGAAHEVILQVMRKAVGAGVKTPKTFPANWVPPVYQQHTNAAPPEIPLPPATVPQRLATKPSEKQVPQQFDQDAQKMPAKTHAREDDTSDGSNGARTSTHVSSNSDGGVVSRILCMDSEDSDGNDQPDPKCHDERESLSGPGLMDMTTEKLVKSSRLVR